MMKKCLLLLLVVVFLSGCYLSSFEGISSGDRGSGGVGEVNIEGMDPEAYVGRQFYVKGNPQLSDVMMECDDWQNQPGTIVKVEYCMCYRAQGLTECLVTDGGCDETCECVENRYTPKLVDYVVEHPTGVPPVIEARSKCNELGGIFDYGINKAIIEGKADYVCTLKGNEHQVSLGRMKIGECEEVCEIQFSEGVETAETCFQKECGEGTIKPDISRTEYLFRC